MSELYLTAFLALVSETASATNWIIGLHPILV